MGCGSEKDVTTCEEGYSVMKVKKGNLDHHKGDETWMVFNPYVLCALLTSRRKYGA